MAFIKLNKQPYDMNLNLTADCQILHIKLRSAYQQSGSKTETVQKKGRNPVLPKKLGLSPWALPNSSYIQATEDKKERS